jgi:hypothetical protein
MSWIRVGEVADQAQTERALNFVARQAGGGVQHGLQAVAFRQIAAFGSDAPGDLLDLLAAGQVVLDDHEELLQFRGDQFRKPTGTTHLLHGTAIWVSLGANTGSGKTMQQGHDVRDCSSPNKPACLVMDGGRC